MNLFLIFSCVFEKCCVNSKYARFPISQDLLHTHSSKLNYVYFLDKKHRKNLQMIRNLWLTCVYFLNNVIFCQIHKYNCKILILHQIIRSNLSYSSLLHPSCILLNKYEFVTCCEMSNDTRSSSTPACCCCASSSQQAIRLPGMCMFIS